MKKEMENKYSVIAYYEDKTVTVTTNDENIAIQEFCEMEDANKVRIIDNYTGEICAENEDNKYVSDEWLFKFVEFIIKNPSL